MIIDTTPQLTGKVSIEWVTSEICFLSLVANREQIGSKLKTNLFEVSKLSVEKRCLCYFADQNLLEREDPMELKF